MRTLVPNEPYDNAVKEPKVKREIEKKETDYSAPFYQGSPVYSSETTREDIYNQLVEDDRWPCNYCEKVRTDHTRLMCNAMCPMWKKWFRGEWKAIRRTFGKGIEQLQVK